jgi:chemotaxis regulatin CheY-phosphate phosphatase CheZ
MNCIKSNVNKDEAMSNILGQIDKIHRIGELIKDTKDYSKVVDINSIIDEIRNQIYTTDLVDEIDQSEESQDVYDDSNDDILEAAYLLEGVKSIQNCLNGNPTRLDIAYAEWVNRDLENNDSESCCTNTNEYIDNEASGL